MAPLLDRYLAGEHERVWEELVSMGPLIRQPEMFSSAYAVAPETMRRARANVETLRKRLSAMRYEFSDLTGSHVAPEPGIEQRMTSFETKIGPLPLSLRAFYEIVGSVNFCQSGNQPGKAREKNVARNVKPDSAELELLELGKFDPLAVAPFSELEEDVQQTDGRVYFCFAADEFHKANYSGGENYHVWIPDWNADFPIQGMYEIDELFVAYLRESFRGGGFRGKCETDDDRARKVPPDLRLNRQLASGLLPL